MPTGHSALRGSGLQGTEVQEQNHKEAELSEPMMGSWVGLLGACGGLWKQRGRRKAGHAQKEPCGGGGDGISLGNPGRGPRRPDKMFQGL